MNLTYGNTLVQQSVDDYLKQCQLKKVQNYHISSYSTYEFVNVDPSPQGVATPSSASGSRGQ